MKNNNIFKYIFIAFIILLIIGTVWIIYNQNTKEDENNDSEKNIIQTSVQVLDSLTMGISNYDTMNPLITNNKEIINISKIIFEPLITITPDYKTEMCLAKSCEKKSDTVYEIKLNTQIRWQDGSDFIARDVQFTIEKLKERNTVYSANVKDIQSVEVPDSETVIINLSRPVNFFEYNLTFPILSSMYYMNENFVSTNKIPIGTGLYKIASIDENTILLTRNDKWRNIKDKQPKAKSITIKKYSSMGEIYNSFKLGNIDIINTSNIKYSEHVGTMGYNKKEYPGRDYDFISFNCEDSILKDKEVRKAINYAVDKNSIVSSVFSNNYYVSNSPLDYRSYYYNSESQISYNQEQAKKTLEQAGWMFKNNKWQKNIDGYVRRLTISLIVDKDNEARVNVANIIKTQLESIGITVNITSVTNEKYKGYLENKNYQMILTGITNSVNPDLSYFCGEGNIANFNSSESREKLNSLDNLKSIQKILNEEVPYIGLYRNKCTLILNANVGGSFSPNSYNLFYNFNEWFRQQ